MAKKRADSEILSFRMRKDLADRIRQAAKERGESIQTYFLNQVDNSSELAQIIEEVNEQAKEKKTKVIGAVADLLIGVNEIKEKLNVSDEEFTSLLVKSMKEWAKEKTEEIDK